MRVSKEKEALLSQKLLWKLFDYNKHNGVFVNLVSRGSRAMSGQVAGSVTNHGYITIRLGGYPYQAHRLAWLYVYGEFPQGEDKPYIDHINRNRADNRVINLKASSQAENNRNTRMHSNNTSGVTGVHRVKGGSASKVLWYWRATWCDENGKQQMKNFPIHKLGEEESKQLAITHRAEQIQMLESEFEIKYSDRHGNYQKKEAV